MELDTSRDTDPAKMQVINFDEVAHELNNALTIATAYAQVLLKRLPVWATARDQHALLAIRRSLTTATNLLAPEDVTQRPTRCDLSELIGEAVIQMPPGRLPDLTVVAPPSKPIVGFWHRQHVVVVLVNLLQNAAKYSSPGSPILMTARSVGDMACVTVHDQGIGIASDDLAAIFEGFRTERARLTAPGTGIGLVLSRRLVTAERGTLRAESVDGQGTTFTLRLPLNNPDA